jgi:head-tail adaptor
MIGAGRLRERITIRRRVETKNDGGGLDLTWSDLATDIAAEVICLDGREALIDNVLQGISSFRLTVRFRRDVKVSDQILWRDRELNIRSAEDRTGTREWLTIMATNEAPQGA